MNFPMSVSCSQSSGLQPRLGKIGASNTVVVEKISNKAQTLKVAPWTDSKAEMGPLISSEHKKKVLDLIDKGEK